MGNDEVATGGTTFCNKGVGELPIKLPLAVGSSCSEAGCESCEKVIDPRGSIGKGKATKGKRSSQARYGNKVRTVAVRKPDKESKGEKGVRQ